MNRFAALLFAVLLLLTGCVGRAASTEEAPPDLHQAEEIASTASQPLYTVPAPEPEPEPEEPYIRVVDPTGPMVALTFDDGPDPVYTAQLLDILEEHHAVATFFEVGRNVALYPEQLPRMAELGCEIGSHSNAHGNLSKMKKSALLQDLDTADQAFLSAGAAAPTLVRPPYGAVNKNVKSASGRTVVTWTVDTLDWQSRDAQTIVDYVQSLSRLDGQIVLLHSTYESTVKAAEVLVPWLQEQGYQLVTVTELMAYYYGQALGPDQFYGYTYFSTHSRTDTPLVLPSQAEGDAPEALPEGEVPAVPAEGTDSPAPPPQEGGEVPAAE